MKKKHLLFIIPTIVIFVPIHIYAKDIQSRYRRRSENDFESNYIHDVHESSSAGYNSFIINADNAYTPSPKESMTTHTIYRERQSPLSNYQQHAISANFKHQSPMKNMEKKFSEKESRFKEKKYNPNEEQEYGYILTARGKENIYEEDMANGYKPHEYEVFYPRKFESERISELKSPMYMTGKRVTNYEKSYNKYRYSYSNHGEESSLKPETKLPPNEFKEGQYFLKDLPKTRSFNSELQNFPQHQNQKYGEDFGLKTAAWKQLGPNVEISSSSDSPTYAKPPDGKTKKTYKKRKNSPMKGMRTSYMGMNTPQHALYVANNIPTINSNKGIFDHNNVLKQSDKFEIEDAMTTEVEKENSKKGDHKVRTKQESPKDQPYNFESPDYQNFQFYNPPFSQFYHINPFQNTKFAYPLPGAGLSKGFIRNIEVETDSSGGKKTIPALIIPLTPEQVNNPLFNADTLTPSYANNADINPKSKSVPFPYDIVGTKYGQNDLNNVIPYQNYQFQHFYPYQNTNTQNFEENYAPFVNFANPSLLPRYPTNTNPSPTPSENIKPTTDTTYSTPSRFQNEEQQSNLPFSIVIPNKKIKSPNNSEIERNDYKTSEYYDDLNDDLINIPPAESNFLSTVTHLKENQSVSPSLDKTEHKRT